MLQGKWCADNKKWGVYERFKQNEALAETGSDGCRANGAHSLSCYFTN